MAASAIMSMVCDDVLLYHNIYRVQIFAPLQVVAHFYTKFNTPSITHDLH